MNFQQLEYAIAVHRLKHFGKAADSCHITQATLSAMIIKLEQELNIELFDRSKKPIKTTDTGVRFVEIAERVLKEQAAFFKLDQAEEHIIGELKIGIIPTIANTLLPLILPMVMRDHPDLKLHIAEITTEEIKQQLMMDHIDLGILATPLDDELLEEHILYYEPMMIYGIDNVDKGYVTSKDVKNQRIWLLEEGHCFRNQAITICEVREKDMRENNLNFRGSSFDTLINLTDGFGGYTLLPELYAGTMSDLRKSKTKQFQKPVPVREVSIVTYRQLSKQNAVTYLSNLIKNQIPPLLSSHQFKNAEMEIIGI
ncbi:MAG: LysR family transcriptional regulator [Cyclobacteriaceae bacterium]